MDFVEIFLNRPNSELLYKTLGFYAISLAVPFISCVIVNQNHFDMRGYINIKAVFPFPGKGRRFFCLHKVNTGPKGHSVSY